MKNIDFKIKNIAEIFEGKIIGNREIQITGVNDIENAKKGDITFLSNEKYKKYLDSTKASAVIINKKVELPNNSKLTFLVVKDSYLSFALLLSEIEKLNISRKSGIENPSHINKKSKTIISIFSGRMSDVGKDPAPIIKESVRLTKKMKKVEILWASTREAYNYLQAKDYGCSIITMPPAIIEKIEKFGKSFQNLTLETVKNFLVDSKKSNFKI